MQEPFNRSAEAVVDEADAQGVAFILWFPLAAGPLAATDGPLHQLAVDLDARSRREDREHAGKLDYEGRVWQAKNDTLRRLISACRAVKRQAVTAERHAAVSQEDRDYSHARLAQAVYELPREIGAEAGISEITAYTAEPVRRALDEMLELANERLRPLMVQFLCCGTPITSSNYYGCPQLKAIRRIVPTSRNFKIGDRRP